jgi:hypothetical protein
MGDFASEGILSNGIEVMMPVFASKGMGVFESEDMLSNGIEVRTPAVAWRT